MQHGPTGFASRVGSIPRMELDVLTGDYEGLSRGRVLLMVGAVLYIVAPIDLLPEAILTIPGFADDAAVAGWLIASLLGATSAYRTWENGHLAASDGPRVVRGEVLTP
jgi:uncharacterized membrane protein YkvA (DUF1232 family)